MNSISKSGSPVLTAAAHAYRLNRSDPPGSQNLDGSSSLFSSLLSDGKPGMSETVVESLARGVYAELEKIIAKCGDEKVVEELMPVVVNILEVLGHTYTGKTLFL
jgi:JNK_SAPK-associated protein-1